MNKKTLLILCIVFAALMMAAAVLYNSLADEIELGGLATTPPETEAPTVAASIETTVPETTEPDYSAPDFTMLDWDGNEVKLLDFVGKPIILNFWASWCGPCKMEMPEIQEFYEQYGEEIHFLLVSVDESVDTAKAFIGDTEYTFPVYFDTTSLGAYTYGASSIPLTYFIDAKGDLMAYYRGAMTADILQQGIDMIYTSAETE